MSDKTSKPVREIIIGIETENAAFAGSNLETEVCRILRQLATDIENDGIKVKLLFDRNGNKVGKLIVD